MKLLAVLLFTAGMIPAFAGELEKKSDEVILSLEHRKFEAVDLKDSNIKLEKAKVVAISGIPTSGRTALAVKYKKSDWSGFDYLILNLKPSVDMSPKMLNVSLRNGNKYYKLENAALSPLTPNLPAGKWSQVAYVLAGVQREENREVRIYLNPLKSLTGKKISCDIKISLEKKQKRIKSLSQKKPRIRTLPQPYLAARAHIKYGLHINWFFDPDYYAERILMLDRSLEKGAAGNDTYGVGSEANFLRTVELMRMSGVDGIAMINMDISSTYLKRTLSGIEYAENAGLKSAIVPEISIFLRGTGDEYLDRQIRNQGVKALGSDALQDKLFPAAIKSPSTFKYNGKTLISSYQACVLPPSFWGDYFKECRGRFGDKLLFMVELRAIFYKAMHRYRANGGLSQREIDEMRDYLYAYLQACDGIHFAGQNHIVKPPNTQIFYYEFYQNIIIPLLTNIMNEPQNKGKLLGLGISKGYMNHLAGSGQSEEGTKNLRFCLETVIKANPDYLLLVEWNEIKERTNLEPTIADGRSSMRIMRYYFNKLKQQPNKPLPEDNPAVPNMVLSYRPQIAPGEKMDFELINVNDTGEPENATYKVKLELIDLQGKVVKSFEPVNLASKGLQEINFVTYAGSDIAPAFILMPKLTITQSGGKEIIFDRGFPYINISATDLRDEKYYKIPLRDLPDKARCDFQAEVKNNSADVKASVDGPEKIAFIEILRNRRPIYSAVESPEYKRSGNERLIKITWNGWKESRKDFKTLEIAVKGGEIKGCEFTNRGWGRNFKVKRRDDKHMQITMENLTHGARRGIYLIIDGNSKELEFASGKFAQTISIPALINNGFYRMVPGNGFNIMVEDFRRIPDLPPHLNKKHFAMNKIIPDVAPRDILSLRYITVDGRIFRSKPIIATSLTPDVIVDAWSDKDNKPTQIKVAAPAAMPVVYKFDPAYGAMLTAPGFDSRFNAQLGGSTNYGDPFFNRQSFPAKSRNMQPEWIDVPGKPAYLRFDGKGNNLVIPLYATPARAFSLEFEIKAESDSPQMLWRSYSKTGGPLMVILDKGKLKFRYVSHNVTSFEGETPALIPTGKKCKVIIAFDLDHIKVKVDNGRIYSCPARGVPSKMTQLVFGGIGNGLRTGYFKGDLYALKIYPYSIIK